MKPVSQRFLDDVRANKSPPVRYNIELANENNERRDITNLACRDKLFRTDWELEGTLTAFRQGDGSLTIVYEESLWEWIQASEEIKIYIDCGFSYEKPPSFRGYIDKRNTEYDTSGLINMKIYPVHKKLEQIKVSTVTKPTLNPTLVKDAVAAIFTKAGITNQSIKVTAMDTHDNKYMDNYLDIAEEGEQFAPICPVSERVFFVIAEAGIRRVEFTEDWSDYTIETIIPNIEGECLRFEKWRDDYFVAVMGLMKYKQFYNGAIPVEDWDYVATQVIALKADGTILHNFVPADFTQYSITFYPRARMISPLFDERTGSDYFLIGYNGVLSGETAIRYCAVRMFDMSAPTAAIRYYLYYYKMFHPSFWLCGGGKGRAWVYPMKIGTIGASGQTIYKLSSVDGTYWVHHMRITAVNPDSFYAKGAWSLGKYILFGWNTSAFDYEIMDGVLNFLPSGYTSAIDGNCTNDSNTQTEARQFIVGYKESNGRLYVKKYFNDETYENESIVEPLRPLFYKDTGGIYQEWNQQFIYGFKYWYAYNTKLVLLGPPQMHFIYGGVGFICIVGARMLPFMSLWTSAENNDGLLTTLEKIAQGFNCLFNITDFDTGWFYSREYVGDEWIIPKLSVRKFQDISKDEIYEILVKYNSSETLIGSGAKRLTIDTPYLANHEVAAQTIGQNYYDFFSTFRWLIKVKTDFLIFLELFDFTYLWDLFVGWIMSTSQENDRYTLKLRARKV